MGRTGRACRRYGIDKGFHFLGIRQCYWGTLDIVAVVSVLRMCAALLAVIGGFAANGIVVRMREIRMRPVRVRIPRPGFKCEKPSN
jgi:hypothetical protein